MKNSAYMANYGEEDQEMEKDAILKELFYQEDGPHPIAYSYTGRYMEWKIKDFILRSFFKEARRYNSRPLKVLDLGCSNGGLTFNLSNIFSEFHFVGVDINPHFIDYANRRVIHRKEKRMNFFVGDAEHLDFDDKSFGVIIASELLEHLANPEGAIKEICRLLANNGVAIISVPNGNNLLECALMKKMKRLMPRGVIFEPNKNRMEEHEKFSLGHHSMFDRQKWIQLFQKHSLCVERYQRGALFWGGNWIDSHRILFALSILVDVFFDKFSIFNDVTENCLFVVRKKV